MRLNEIKSSGGYLDVGLHEAFIFDWKMDETKSGKKYARVTFKDNDSNIHFEKFFLTENSLWRIKDLCLACGIDDNYDIDIVIDESINLNFLVSKALKIELKKESFMGNDGQTKYNTVVKAFYPMPKDTEDDGSFNTTSDPF